jgi:hypothetical protein
MGKRKLETGALKQHLTSARSRLAKIIQEK